MIALNFGVRLFDTILLDCPEEYLHILDILCALYQSKSLNYEELTTYQDVLCSHFLLRSSVRATYLLMLPHEITAHPLCILLDW